jgi:SAM-dependent methyltransferase
MGIEGVVDRVTNSHVDGWAYRDDNVSEHLRMTVRLRDVEVGFGTADRFREDLRAENIGEGDHAYFIAFHEPIDDGLLDEIVVLAFEDDQRSVALPLPPPESPEKNVGENLEEEPNFLPAAPAFQASTYDLPYAQASELLVPAGPPGDFLTADRLDECAALMRVEAEEVRERIARDVFPIPQSNNREGYASGDDLGYWLSGYGDYLMIKDLAAEYGVIRGRYFDFGGSTGRVFRHFALQSEAWDVWSCDFKISSLEFNLKYFPSRIRVFLNSSLPSLPVPDAYFDLISACSVFTHIDEGETGWLLELRRTLKVGGIACISIHSKETWERNTGELLADVTAFRPDIADLAELPEGKTVVTFRNDDPYKCHTFHSDDYIHRNWGRFFEICEVRPLVLGLQAMVVCRRVD